MAKFKALLATKDGDGQQVAWSELDDGDLMEGDVTIRVTHSTLNYKDGLAITRTLPVIDNYPMVPGIDLAGVVEESGSSEFKVGDQVLVNGCGLGERHFGGYAARARQVGVGGAGPAGLELPRCHGGRYGRLHGDALRAGSHRS